MCKQTRNYWLFLEGREKKKRKDYQGFYTHAASWETIINKFNAFSEPYKDPSIRESIIDVVRNIENYKIGELMKLMENLSA